MRKYQATVAIVTLTTSVLGASGAAFASTESVIPNACSDGTDYHTSQSDRYIPNTSTRVYGQSGGTLSISSGRTSTVTGTLTVTGTAEAGAIFTQVSVAVGVSVAKAKSVTTTVSYTWTVPSTQSTGWIEFGGHGYNISWSHGYYNSSCVWVARETGIGTGTTSNPQFAHS